MQTSKYDNRVVGFLGMKGHGKTTLLKHFLALELQKNRNVLLYMPNDFLNYKENISKPFIKREIPMSEVGKFLYEKVSEMDGQACSIFIDELDMLKFTEDLDYLFRFSRNLRCNIYYTAKRTADINKLVVSQSDQLYILKHTEENDLIRLSKINKTLYKLVPKLDKFQAYIIEDRNVISKIEFNFHFPTLETSIKLNLTKIKDETEEIKQTNTIIENANLKDKTDLYKEDLVVNF